MPTAIMLGSGTSNGVPTLGRKYTAEFLAEPRNHRTRPSLLLQGPTGNVLVDCAPEMRLQLLREGIDDVKACIITHTHADHVMGMDDLRAFCLKNQQAMPVYTYPRYQEDIKRIFRYAFEDVPAHVWIPRFDLREPQEFIEECGLSIRTLQVIHGDMPVIALRIGDFAYVTDVSEIPPEAMAHLSGLQTLILDAVRYRPHKNHFHFEKAVAIAKEIGAGMTYFTHLSDDFHHPEVEDSLPTNIRLGFDGLRIAISV